MTAEAMESTKVVSHGLDHSLVHHPSTGLLSRRDCQSTLPGQPWATLSSNKELLAYLRRNHGVSSLERLQLKVGLFANNRTVAPLHASYGRTTLTEHPDLHLARWSPLSFPNDAVVYLKPIPVYMLSTAFWTWLAAADAKTYAAALGFMRTYYSLIRYEADFRLATQLGLIPRIPAATDVADQMPTDYRRTFDPVSGGYQITYEGFVEFIAQFAHAHVPDAAVAPRFRFGELEAFHDDAPRRLFLKPWEQEEEEHNRSTSTSTTNSKDDAKANGKVDHPVCLQIPLSLAVCCLLSGAVLVWVWGWDGAPSVVRWIVLGSLGVITLFFLLCMLLSFFQWLFQAATPKDKISVEPISDVSTPEETKKEAEIKPKEEELLIDGLDMA
ncbi:hypothetical protein PG993_009151 [Apiospora rasikravindrae]|uniref:Uncharacterized protein n=1 Tax=Apiospora rasikravindrae TaxID=990691 RepID=A0ABR1SIK1_9PEZI